MKKCNLLLNGKELTELQVVQYWDDAKMAPVLHLHKGREIRGQMVKEIKANTLGINKKLLGYGDTMVKVVKGLTLEGSPMPGVYIPVKDEILIDSLADNTIIEHELVHRFTSNYIEHFPESIKVKQLESLMEESKKGLNELEFPDLFDYAYRNTHEFAAEALSDPYFQKYLRSLPLDYWDRFKQWLANLIGKEYNYLTKITDRVYDIMDSQKELNIPVNSKIHQAQGTRFPIAFKLDLVSGIEKLSRNTFRLSKEKGIRKDLSKMSVPKNQIDLIFQFMKDNQLEEISKENLLKEVSKYVFDIDIVTSVSTQEDVDRDLNDFPINVGFDLNNEPGPSKFYSTISLDQYNDNPNYQYQEFTINTPFDTIATEHFADSDKSGASTIGHIRGYRNVKEGTFHVIEFQSDLFQKNRDTENLTFRNKTSQGDRIIFKKEGKYYFNDEFAGHSGEPSLIEISKNKYFEILRGDNQNQFLQFLNKDGKWVRFFINSIVQKVAQDGFTKVLFPTGVTAAKVEGHETIQNEINKLRGKLNYLNDTKIKRHRIEVDNNRILEGYFFDYPDTDQEFIGESKTDAQIQLKQRKDHIKEKIQHYQNAGVEKLKPIESFYENRVGNILNKDFDVKRVKDSYGYEWRELPLASFYKYSFPMTGKLTTFEEINSIKNFLTEEEKIQIKNCN